MASDVDNVCASDPNYAAICSFIDQFGDLLGLGEISFTAIKNFLENSSENDANLKEIIIKLLRRVGQRCDNEEKIQKSLVKFLQKHNKLDAWEVERFGFTHSEVATKIRALKLLLEAQFDKNSKFKEKVNERTTVDLRLKPVGRDKNGMSYWYLLDKEANILIYREEQDSEDKEGFKLVCTNREELALLITNLQDGGDLVSLKSEDSQSVTSNTSKVSELKEDDGSLPPLKEEENETPESSTDNLPVTKSEVKSEVKEEEKKDVKKESSEETKAKLTNGEKQEQEDKPAEEVSPEPEGKSTEKSGEEAANIEVRTNEEDNSRENLEEEAVTITVSKSPTPPLDSPTSPPVAPPVKSTTTLLKCPTPPPKSATPPPPSSTPPLASTVPALKCPTPPPRSSTPPVASTTSKESERPERAEKCLKRVEEVEDEIPAKARRRSGSVDTPSIVVTDTSNQEKVLLEKIVNQPENTDDKHSRNEQVDGESVEMKKSDPVIPDKPAGDVTEKPSGIPDTLKQNVTDSSIIQVKKVPDDTEVPKKIAPDDPEQIADNTKKTLHGEKSEVIDTVTAAGDDDGKKGNEGEKTKDAEISEAGGSGMKESTPARDADVTAEPETDKPAKRTRENSSPDKKLETTTVEPGKEPADESVEPEQSKVDENGATSNDHNGDLEEDEDESKDVDPDDTPKKAKRKRERIEIPVEHLRRSTRSQKKRKILYDEIENIPPVKASRKNKHQTSPSKSGGKKRRDDRGDRGLGSSSDSDTPLSRVRSKRAREKSKETSAKCRKLAEEAVKKKSKRKKVNSDEDFNVKGKKKGRKRRKSSGSSDSSSDVIEEGSESEELRFGASSDSDEFALEDSDSESDSSKVKKGRNARRQEARQEKAAEVDDDKPCQICQKHEHPEWILLCDTCDDGYHTTCLRPPIMLIPEGDWFCPPCEHKVLIESLAGRLKLLDQQLKKREHLVIRKERLAFINVNLDNILKDGGREEVVLHSKHKKKKKKKQRHRSPSPFQRRSSRIRDRYVSDDESEEDSYEEEILFTRSTRRRKEINYHFDDYDQLIDEAIGEEVKAVQACPRPGPKPGRSRGKDIANIEGMEEAETEKPPGVMVGRGKRKGRRLTCLDVDEASNEDDSEEYKASEDSVSHVESEDDFLDDNNSDSVSGDSEVVRSSRRKSGKKVKGGRFARYRADGFVVASDADSDDEDDARPSRRSRRKRIDYRDRDSDTSDDIVRKLAPKKPKPKGRKSDSDFQASDQSSGTEVEPVISDKDSVANSDSSGEVSTKHKRHKYEEDSDFSGHVPHKLKKVYKHKAKLYKKVTGKHKTKRKDSSTEESESDENQKKKKKKNVIESDSDEETEAENESDHEGGKSEDEPTKQEASVEKEKGETEAVEEGAVKEGTVGEGAVEKGTVKEATVKKGTVKEGTSEKETAEAGAEVENSEEEEEEEDEGDEEDEDEEEEDSEGDMHVISKKPKLKTKPVSVKKEHASKLPAVKALKKETVAPTEPVKSPAEIKKETHVTKSKVSKPVNKQTGEKQDGDKGQKPPTAELPIVKQEPVELPTEPVPPVHPPVSAKLECEPRQSPPVTQALPRQPVVKPEPRDVNSPVHCSSHLPNMPPSLAGVVKPEHRHDSCLGGSPVHPRDSPVLKPRMGSPHNISPGPLPHPHTSYAGPPPHNNSGLISYRPQFGIMGHGSRPQVPPIMSPLRRPEYPPQGFPLHGGPMPPYQYGPPHLPPHMVPHGVPHGVPPQFSGHLMEMQRMVSPMDNHHTGHHNGGMPPQPHGPPPPLVRAPPPHVGALPPHGSQLMAPNSLAPHGGPMPGGPMPGGPFPMDASRIPHPMEPNYHMPLDNRNATPPVSGSPPTGSPRPQAGPARKKEEEDLSEVSDLLSFVSGFERTSTS